MKKPKNIVQDKTLELELSLLNIPSLHERWLELSEMGWNIYCVNQRRGFCDSYRKIITIPLWAIEGNHGNGYWIYYVAHELAHTNVPDEMHGDKFMQEFIKLCPIEYQHYELGYMPRAAIRNGISKEHASKVMDIKLVNLFDLL